MIKPLVDRLSDLEMIIRNRSDISSSRQEIVDSLNEARKRIIEIQTENYRLKHLDKLSRMK